MSETKTMEPSEPEHSDHSPPYLQALGALAVLTVIEVIVGSLEGTDFIVVFILAILALAKAAIVIAVFMHVAYEKDSRHIIFFSFILPMIGVLLLSFTIGLDYRGY